MKQEEFGRLMDFARFSGHSRIAAMAAAAEQRYPAAALSDDDLKQLFAAGDPAIRPVNEGDPDGH